MLTELYEDYYLKLREAAYTYWLLGLNVVLVKGKQPLHDWQRWRMERQSWADFESLPWDRAEGFAVIGGSRLNNGLYFAAIDYDVKNVSLEAREKGAKALNLLPPTRVEETPSGGQHWFYFSHVKPRTVSVHHNAAALELIGDGKLCIMSPSRGYRVLKGTSIEVVEDVEDVFYQALKVEDERAKVNGEVEKGPLEEWLEQILDSGLLKLAGKGLNYWVFHCPFHPPDNHPSFALKREKLFFIDYHDGKVYGVKALAEKLGLLKPSLEGAKKEGGEKSLEVKLGGFKPAVRDGDFFLLNEEGRPIYTCKIQFANSEKVKARLVALTGQPVERVEEAIASLYYQVKVKQKGGASGFPRKNGGGGVIVDEDPVNVGCKLEEVSLDQPRYDEEVEAQIEAEVQRVMEAENQLEALNPHLDNVIVGEDSVKQAILVLLASSKFSEVKKKQIVILKGTEGGGKTTLASALTAPFKTKEVGRFTEHALEYSDLSSCEVLYIKELGSMDMDKQGVASIKFLSADDKGFMVEYTVKDESGRFKTEQKRIPAMTTVTTTTRLVLDSQFERRAWLFNIDESEEQTERVKRWKALVGREKDEVKLGLRKVTDYDFSRMVIQRFISRLQPRKIIIPFREALADVLNPKELRVRGDVDKLYSFIELYALLNLRRLWKVKDEVYAVTPEVAVEALKIAEKPLANMLGGGDERIKPLLQALKDLRLERDSMIDKAKREEMAVKLGKSEVTVRLYLNFLEKRGILSSDNKKPKTYTLLYSLKEVEEKVCESPLISKINDDLCIKMEKEAQNWLNSLSLKPPSTDETGEKALSQYSPSIVEGFNDHRLESFRDSFTEISSNHRELGKSTMFRNISTKLEWRVPLKETKPKNNPKPKPNPNPNNLASNRYVKNTNSKSRAPLNHEEKGGRRGSENEGRGC